MHLGPNIKRIRKRWRFPQKEFADLLLSTVGMISQYEQGNNDPKIPFLLRLERVSGISCKILYNRLVSDEEIPEKPLETVLEVPPATAKEVQEPDVNHARKVNTGMLVWMQYMEHRIQQLEDQIDNNKKKKKED
jgi:Helix-turn-helix.